MLTLVLVDELASHLGLSAKRDVDTIRRRCEHEGFAFLSLTLPLLSDALERGLEEGRLTCPSNFSVHGRLPRLLGGFFSRVFARTGELLDCPDVDAIYAIRQISRLWKKPKMACDTDREAAAADRFFQVEEELRVLTPNIVRKDDLLDNVAGILWSQVFPEIDSNDIVCRHGPGVTADRYSLNGRYRIREWYTRSELTFPAARHAFHNYGSACGEWGASAGIEGIRYWDIRDEPGVRVVFVPKTMASPRVIAIEPSAMQYLQQGLMTYTVERLERHRLTARSIRFSDQTVNQRLALQSSVDKRLATLDLKDASDRVHLALVQRIFKRSGILEYLEDTRSLHATLPDGRNLVLSKFASMGSAMCFPVEAMVFYTLVQTAMHSHHGKRPTSSSIRRFSRDIAIYGDDIIVPVDVADAVTDYLEAYGLKVNVAKSFRHSLFRESCGGDYFNGHDVKPVYAREFPFDDRRQWTADTVQSWVATSNQFYLKGLWKTTQFIRDMLESVLRCRIPRSKVETQGVAFLSLMFDTDCLWERDLQCWKQRRVVFTPSKKKDDIDGDATACFNRVLGRSVSSEASCDSGPERNPKSHAFVRPIRLRMERGVCVVEGFQGSGERASYRFARDLQELLQSSGVIDEPSRPVGKSGEAGRVTSRSTADAVESLIMGPEMDIHASVKRGAFKSKRRWVTLAA
jgi:hypothetical protein